MHDKYLTMGYVLNLDLCFTSPSVSLRLCFCQNLLPMFRLFTWLNEVPMLLLSALLLIKLMVWAFLNYRLWWSDCYWVLTINEPDVFIFLYVYKPAISEFLTINELNVFECHRAGCFWFSEFAWTDCFWICSWQWAKCVVNLREPTVSEFKDVNQAEYFWSCDCWWDFRWVYCTLL